MNRILKLTFLLVLLFAWSTMIYTQEDDKSKIRTFSIQANPIIYLGDIIYLGLDDDTETYLIALDLEFQYAFSNYLNLSVNPSFSLERYRSRWYEDTNGNESNIVYGEDTQLLFNLALLYRPFGTRLKGVYIGLEVPIGWSNISRDGYTDWVGWSSLTGDRYKNYPSIDDNFFLIGIGALIGYQWVFEHGFTISLGSGGQKLWSIAAKENTEIWEDTENLFKLPFDLTLTFRLGYSF